MCESGTEGECDAMVTVVTAGAGSTEGVPRVPSPAELRNEALRKGKNTFQPVNRTGQRAGIVVAYTFSQREGQVT